MFEEIAVWKRVDETVAIRFVGFRDLETDQIWIAFGNFVARHDGDRGTLSADQLICASSTIEAVLDSCPADAEQWKPTISEAVSFFLANNRFE